MNGKQRCVLIGVAAVLVLMVLFPPFHHLNVQGAQVGVNEYSFLFAAPVRTEGLYRPHTATVNYMMLVIQLLVAVVVGAITYLVIKD